MPLKKISRLKKIIYSQENLIYTHDACNKEKEDFQVEVDALFLPEEKKRSLRRLGREIGPYFQCYTQLKGVLYQAQGGRCRGCGASLPISRAVMRRIDPAEPRVRENACLVCHSCNSLCADFKEAGLPLPEKIVSGGQMKYDNVEELI